MNETGKMRKTKLNNSIEQFNSKIEDRIR